MMSDSWEGPVVETPAYSLERFLLREEPTWLFTVKPLNTWEPSSHVDVEDFKGRDLPVLLRIDPAVYRDMWRKSEVVTIGFDERDGALVTTLSASQSSFWWGVSFFAGIGLASTLIVLFGRKK